MALVGADKDALDGPSRGVRYQHNGGCAVRAGDDSLVPSHLQLTSGITSGTYQPCGMRLNCNPTAPAATQRSAP